MRCVNIHWHMDAKTNRTINNMNFTKTNRKAYFYLYETFGIHSIIRVAFVYKIYNMRQNVFGVIMFIVTFMELCIEVA